jgi:hypothetical protein
MTLTYSSILEFRNGVVDPDPHQGPYGDCCWMDPEAKKKHQSKKEKFKLHIAYEIFISELVNVSLKDIHVRYNDF